jgi:hypothetical protein
VPIAASTGDGIIGRTAKRPTMLELEELLLEATRTEAHQTGRSESEVVEDVLRQHFESRRTSVTDEVSSRNAAEQLTGDEALRLAYDELKETRRYRREAGGAAPAQAVDQLLR